MLTHRRDFIFRTAGAVSALTLAPTRAFGEYAATQLAIADWARVELRDRGGSAGPAQLAYDEPFWAEIRRAFALDPNVVNLDNGWTNPAPRLAVDEVVRGARELEGLPAEHLERIWLQVTNTIVRPALAEAMGVPGSEIAFVRNATEALNTVLLGVPLRAGDEVVCSAHDYFAMLDALEQRRLRDGVVLRMVRPPVPAPSLDALAEMYEAVIGPRTKLVLVTHPSNLTGQLFPVQRIAVAAHRVGAEVVVDGAQSLGILEDPISALDCDYYGASGHKWLGAPVGVGVLWMRPAHVQKVWPLIPSPPGEKGMARFEWIGTAPSYVEPAMLPALALQKSLGAGRKAARLRYLTSYWRNKAAAAFPQARFYSGADPAMGCGLCTIELPGIDSSALKQRLRDQDRILVQSMAGNARAPEIRGIRVSPNVYTTPAELDQLVAALARAAAAMGAPRAAGTPLS